MSKKIQPSGSADKPGKKLSGLASLSLGLSGPTGMSLPRQFNQLVIFLLDGSGSMTFDGETGTSKGSEVSTEVSKVMSRLVKSKNKECFDVAIYAFANEHKVILDTTAVTKVNLGGVYDPCQYIKDYRSTRLATSLELARNTAQSFVEKHDKPGFPAKAMIIVLSDGVIHDFEEASRITAQAKLDARIFISSVFFSSDECSEQESSEAQEMLRSLASGGGLFSITDTVSDIREHMIHSIKTTMTF